MVTTVTTEKLSFLSFYKNVFIKRIGKHGSRR